MKKQKTLAALVLASISLSSLNGCITYNMDKKFIEWAYIQNKTTNQQQDKDYQQNEQVAYLNE